MTIQLYNEGSYGTGSYGGAGTPPTTYDECLQQIDAAQYASIKLALISLLPGLRGDNNPSYRLGIEVLANQTNQNVIDALQSEIYTFIKVPTQEEIDCFGYTEVGYIDDDPGIVANTYSSYIGVYFNNDGEST